MKGWKLVPPEEFPEGHYIYKNAGCLGVFGQGIYRIRFYEGETQVYRPELNNVSKALTGLDLIHYLDKNRLRDLHAIGDGDTLIACKGTKLAETLSSLIQQNKSN